MNRKLLSLLLASLALTGFVSLAGCSGKAAEAQQAAAKKDVTPAIPVEVAQVRRGDVAATYSGTSTLEADQEATVVAKVEGTVSQLFTEEGAQVHAGQALAKLDDAKLRFDCEQAQANYEKKRQEFERSQKLYDHHLISLDAYDSVKYDLAALKASYDIAKFNLDNAVIRAPIDGIVAKRLVKVGNTLTVNQSVFVISNFDPLLAVLYVPENALPELRKGQPATLSADAAPGKQFDGHIARISPVVDPQTGTFKVTVELRHVKGELAPGMFSRVRITYDIHHHALLIPRSALVTEDGELAVYVVKAGNAHRVSVKTAYNDGKDIEITSGLKQGDTVVTLGQNSLRDGAKVAVVNPQLPESVAAGNQHNPQV
ncbi:MAG TPA: efflux RND transporter periplasmic adaptor subunit [Gammaproteobacteria bacterium]|nr:efflux RND transporter periplasmic adaptor subunit [Gammaproteobacteria bacterium]